MRHLKLEQVGPTLSQYALCILGSATGKDDTLQLRQEIKHFEQPCDPMSDTVHAWLYHLTVRDGIQGTIFQITVSWRSRPAKCKKRFRFHCARPGITRETKRGRVVCRAGVSRTIKTTARALRPTDLNRAVHRSGRLSFRHIRSIRRRARGTPGFGASTGQSRHPASPRLRSTQWHMC